MNTLKINDKVTIAGKPYRVYNVINEYEGGLVCFGRINSKGEDLSAMNPHNIMSLSFAQVEKFENIGTIVKEGTYTLENKLCDAKPGSAVPEAIWSAVFSFNAKDEQDATSKARGWARYHSFDQRDVRVRPATEHEATYWMHNEYVD